MLISIIIDRQFLINMILLFLFRLWLCFKTENCLARNLMNLKMYIKSH